MFVEDDFIHGLGKFEVDFTKQSCCIWWAFASQSLAVLRHSKNSVDLVIVDFRNLMGWHIFYVVVVFNKRVCVYPVCVGLLESFHELSWVFFVENNVDPVKSALFFGVLPESFISLGLRKVFHDSNFPPILKPILIFPKSLSPDTLKLSTLRSVFGNTLHGRHLQPFMGQPSLILFVIVSLERQPTSRGFLWVSKLYCLTE